MNAERQQEFLELLEPVYQRLWRFSLATTRDHVNAQDLLSETLLEAYERFDSLRDPKAFTSFLFTIATRIERHKTRRARWFGNYDEAAAARMQSVTPSPELAAEIAVLLSALAKLGAKQRETITLFEISGFSLEEIREIQGGTLSGVKSRLRRAREALSRELGIEPEQASSVERATSTDNLREESAEVNRLLSFAIRD
ncbi:MAG: RNA polymerase sigma factor [Candidatus Kapaibacterium sp.]|jgi:RNA polymerase sigma-70 factor (ECF subfamily)